MPEELKIIVGADISQALIGFTKLGDGVTTLQQKVTVFGNGIKTFPKFNLPTIPAGVPASFDRLKTSSQGASLALINTGRVLQDLPFGILGVANNINPLIESFQRLKAESQATGQSIGKSLLGALKGGGGLGLAFSAISAAAIFASIGMQAFGGRMAKTKEEADKTAEKLKDLVKPIDDIAAAARGADFGGIEKVNALADAVTNLSLSDKERNAALLQLRETNKNYFGDLTLEAASLATLKGRVEEYTQALVAASVVKAFGDEIGRVGKEMALQDLRVSKLTNSLKRLKDGVDENGAPIIKLADITGSANETINSLTKSLDKETPVLKTLKDQFNDLGGAMRKAVLESLKFKPLDTKDTGKNLDDARNKLISFAKSIQSEFDQLVPIKIDDLFDTKNIQFAKAQEIVAAFLKGFPNVVSLAKKITVSGVEFEVPQPTIKIPSPEFNFSGIPDKLRNALHAVLTPEEFARAIGRLNDQFETTLPFNLILDLQVAIANGDTVKQRAILLVSELNQAVKNIAVEGIAGLAESIGAVFSGEGIAEGFRNFANVIANGFMAIGKQLILASPVIAALKAALKTLNPAILLPAGIALVAIGAALRNIIGKGIEGRERGGRVNKGQPYIVGEKRPELFVPDQPGNIIPFVPNLKESKLFQTFKQTVFYDLSKTFSTFIDNRVYETNYLIQSFKNAVSNLKHYEAGGPVTSNTPIIVGERGIEVFVPNAAGRIISNNQLSSAGIRAGEKVLTGKLYGEGQSLVALVSVVNKSNARNF